MNSDYERNLEAQIDRELRALPDLRAPAALHSRVMAAIERKASKKTDCVERMAGWDQVCCLVSPDRRVHRAVSCRLGASGNGLLGFHRQHAERFLVLPGNLCSSVGAYYVVPRIDR